MLDIEKKRYLYNSIYRMDGILKPAEIIGEAISTGLKLNEIENWNNNLDKVTLEDIKDSLEKFLSNKNFVLGGLKN